jgi:hypothetical protein
MDLVQDFQVDLESFDDYSEAHPFLLTYDYQTTILKGQMPISPILTADR